MNEPEVTKSLENSELDGTEVEEVAGGSLCSADELVDLTASLKEAYENLVDFTSHVIERVAGGSGTT
jgi:hypothetical protein